MKILVTGINGRFGTAIARLAAERGHEVVGVSRRGWPDDQPLPAGVVSRKVDTADIAAMTELMSECQAMIHTSGLHGSHLKSHSLGDFLEVNVTQVGRLLAAAHSVGLRRICLSSTIQVHCGYTQRASGTMILEENLPARGDTAYSISKRTMEILGEEMARVFGLSVLSLRLGAFGYVDDAALGPKLLNLAISSADAARAAFLAVEKSGFQGEVVLIAPASPFRQEDLVEGQQDPEAVLERYYPGAGEVLRREGHRVTPAQFASVCSIRRARIFLGWEPQLTFASWLRLKGWTNEPASPAVQ